jgi:general secretion pathway protein M
MNEWFQQLVPRERMLVMAAAGLAVIALIGTLGIRPVVNRVDRGHELVQEKETLLTDLTGVAQRYGPQSGGGGAMVVTDTRSLVVIVDQTTRALGLATHLKRNQPDGASSIRLRFENVPFDSLIGWLGQLESQFGLSTKTANIDVSAEPGRVNCNLTLDRAGA